MVLLHEFIHALLCSQQIANGLRSLIRLVLVLLLCWACLSASCLPSSSLPCSPLSSFSLLVSLRFLLFFEFLSFFFQSLRLLGFGRRHQLGLQRLERVLDQRAE